MAGENGSAETKSGLMCILAMMVWLGGFHVNLAVSVLCLWNLPSPWAFTILALWIMFMFIPVHYGSPIGTWLARFICAHAAAYFPITVVIEDDKAFDPSRSYVIAAEPHSVLPIGIIVLTPQSGFLPISNLRALASTAVFWTPIVRSIWSWLGLVPVTRKSFTELLQRGTSCVVVPGGVQECLYMEYGCETHLLEVGLTQNVADHKTSFITCHEGVYVVFLKNRYGFVRVAMEVGSPLVPTFCFGQTNIYKWWKPKGKWYSQLSRAIGFTPLVFWGRFGGPIPFQKPMYYVVGKPIEVMKNTSPTHAEVAMVLGHFIKATEELFERHKAAAGFADTALHVY